ncbi:MAG: AAA family ATPase, partial [Thermodesulfobacteriota bacterium]|nr:AAA family ATPase [Thermodesulfobacteriota bacterium]
MSRDKVILGRSIADDEIDFDSGFLMMPAAVPEAPAAQPAGAFPADTGAVPPPSVQEAPAGVGVGTGTGPVTTGTDTVGRKKRVVFAFEATREQVFKAFPAIANLA